MKTNKRNTIGTRANFTAKEETFQDWKLTTNNNDYSLFEHLWTTGYFITHPITSKDLEKAVNNR